MLIVESVWLCYRHGHGPGSRGDCGEQEQVHQTPAHGPQHGQHEGQTHLRGHGSTGHYDPGTVHFRL